MKLAHLADLHLGFRQYTRQTPQGINQREADVATAFRRAMDDVIAWQPDVVVIAGDIFHSVRPTNPAILDAFNQFRRMRAALPEVPLILVAGNHDTPRSVETGTILTLFEAIANVYVAIHGARVVHFPSLDLSITCCPHAWTVSGNRSTVHPDPSVHWNVKVVHGEVAGVVPGDRTFAQNAGSVIEPGELQADKWDYVALGHYHTACQVLKNAWYPGALEYVTNNPWGESHEGMRPVPKGAKGWLAVEIGDEGLDVQFRAISLARRHLDLQPIFCQGLTPSAIDEMIAARISEVKGDIDNQVVRQVLYDVPRTVARDLNHAAIRDFKARALHYRFDARRPERSEQSGIATTGRRQTVAELVESYLRECAISPGVNREAFVALGREYLSRVERNLAEA